MGSDFNPGRRGKLTNIGLEKIKTKKVLRAAYSVQQKKS